jgi:predicted metal-dependent peptidase
MTNNTNNTQNKPSVNVPKTHKTTEQIQDRLIRARIDMLMTTPFFGNLATRLRMVDATDWCPTAAVDGRYFYFNRDFVDALNDTEIIWLLGHEIMHCVYDHMDPVRRGNRIPLLWNVANDYVINWELEVAKLGKRIRKEIIEVCFDSKYADQTSEEVYDQLYDELESQGRIQKTSFDMHLERGDGSDSGDDSEPTDAEPTAQGPAKFSPGTQDQIQQEFQGAVIQAAKAAGNSGTPAGVRRMLKDLLEPELDWRGMLMREIRSQIRSDYTWMRPSRKGEQTGVILPGMDVENTCDVAIAIDTSGSISESDLLEFLSEVQGIMDQFQGYRLVLWCFDTEVHNFKVFSPENGHELLEYEPAGGGGTLFECNWRFMQDNDITPSQFVMFTDMYPGAGWGDADYCDTLFIAHNTDRVAPHGTTVKFSRAATGK